MAKAKKHIYTKMTTKMISINGNEYKFTSWMDEEVGSKRGFYLMPASENPNIEKFGSNHKSYKVDYVLLGMLDMVK